MNNAAGAPSLQRILLLGGTSEIGLAIVGELARQQRSAAVLLGRDATSLARAVTELEGADDGCDSVTSAIVDARDAQAHPRAIAAAFELLGGIDVVVVAVGVLGEAGADAALAHPQAALDVLEVNCVGAGSLLLAALERLRAQGSGTAVVLSSVAAERPRKANPVYGASKAGLDALAQGIGDALQGSGVRVMVVRPGFVHTRMTRGLRPAPFATDAGAVARATRRGLERGSHTVWCPAILRPVMALIRLLPRPLFRRLAL
ncbi:MAG: SDR family NAD(P)-dependent oxidoreductase [Solirubrobacteraceae bacterium]|nr:MAG: decaprenylphospho-beta-D-erythro-pentofuranosid-2-ulose 2-reductase [Solirubrobacterales bacterium]